MFWLSFLLSPSWILFVDMGNIFRWKSISLLNSDLLATISMFSLIPKLLLWTNFGLPLPVSFFNLLNLFAHLKFGLLWFLTLLDSAIALERPALSAAPATLNSLPKSLYLTNLPFHCLSQLNPLGLMCPFFISSVLFSSVLTLCKCYFIKHIWYFIIYCGA